MGATCLVTTVPLQCLSLFCLFFNCAYRNIQHTVLYLCFGLCLNWPTFGFMPQSQSPWLGRPQCWSHTRGSHYCWHTPCNCSEKKAFKYNQALAGFDCKREKKNPQTWHDCLGVYTPPKTKSISNFSGQTIVNIEMAQPLWPSKSTSG